MTTIERRRYPLAQAQSVAFELVSKIAPFCQRLAVVGSVRRKRETVGDLEILYVSRFENRADLASSVKEQLAEEEIGRLVELGELVKRPNKNGVFTYGSKNKHLLHRNGMPVDLFSTTLDGWWVSLVIRTGGKATNLRLTTGAQRLGRRLNAYGAGVTCSDGTVIPATSERHVFELCGVPYLEPEERE